MLKIILSAFSTGFAITAFSLYFKDILVLKTKPHAYTWLIWAMTYGTAAAGVWYGGGGLGALSLTLGTFFNISVFIFSLKYGTKNITRSDTFILFLALAAIAVWIQLKKPLVSVILVTAIDLIGYVPSFRKSYAEPWSEALAPWLLFSVANMFALLALTEYNPLTMMYLVAITIANMSLFFFCVLRRRFIPRSGEYS